MDGPFLQQAEPDASKLSFDEWLDATERVITRAREGEVSARTILIMGGLAGLACFSMLLLIIALFTQQIAEHTWLVLLMMILILGTIGAVTVHYFMTQKVKEDRAWLDAGRERELQHQQWLQGGGWKHLETMAKIQYIDTQITQADMAIKQNVDTVNADRDRAAFNQPHEYRMHVLDVVAEVSKYYYWLSEMLKLQEDESLRARADEAFEFLSRIGDVNGPFMKQDEDGKWDYRDEQAKQNAEAAAASIQETFEKFMKGDIFRRTTRPPHVPPPRGKR